MTTLSKNIALLIKKALKGDSESGDALVYALTLVFTVFFPELGITSCRNSKDGDYRRLQWIDASGQASIHVQLQDDGAIDFNIFIPTSQKWKRNVFSNYDSMYRGLNLFLKSKPFAPANKDIP